MGDSIHDDFKTTPYDKTSVLTDTKKKEKIKLIDKTNKVSKPAKPQHTQTKKIELEKDAISEPRNNEDKQKFYDSKLKSKQDSESVKIIQQTDIQMESLKENLPVSASKS